MKLISISLLVFIITTNCILHSVSIEDKTGVTAKENPGTNTKNSIPVKVIFGNTKYNELNIFFRKSQTTQKLDDAYKNIKEEKPKNWYEIGCSKKSKVYEDIDKKVYMECEVGDQVKSNYFSEEYFSKFQRSKFFHIDANSNLKIEINAIPEKSFNISPLMLFAQLTLFAFPHKIYQGGYIQIVLYDIKNNSKIKKYTYKIEHRIYNGWTIPLVGSILPLFSDRYDHSENLKTYSIARVVYNEFEEDFIKDFYSDETLQKVAYLHDPPIYKIQIPSKMEFEKNPYLPYLLAKLESKLLQRGVELIKQENNLNNSTSDIKADRVINIDLLSFQKNTINLNITCLDSKDNTEVWFEKISLPIKSISNENEIDNAIDKLLSNLASKGEIN